MTSFLVTAMVPPQLHFQHFNFVGISQQKTRVFFGKKTTLLVQISADRDLVGCGDFLNETLLGGPSCGYGWRFQDIG